MGDPDLRFRDSLNLCARQERDEPAASPPRPPPPPPPPISRRVPAEAPAEAPEEAPAEASEEAPEEAPAEASEDAPPRASETAASRAALCVDAPPPAYADIVEAGEAMVRRAGVPDDGLATSSAAIGHGVLQQQALRSFEQRKRTEANDEAIARQLQEADGVSPASTRQISQSDWVLQEAQLKDRSDSWIARELATDSTTLADQLGAAEVLRPNTAQRARSDEKLDVQRQRLRGRMLDFGLREHEVAGDGNCQFRALAHQLSGDVERHADVRRRVVRQLALERERYQDFCVMDDASVDADFDGFVKRMAKDGEWGDHVTLQAAADVYGVYVCLVTSYEERGILRVEPSAAPANPRTIWIAFWAEVHYSSIMPGAH